MPLVDELMRLVTIFHPLPLEQLLSLSLAAYPVQDRA